MVELQSAQPPTQEWPPDLHSEIQIGWGLVGGMDPPEDRGGPLQVVEGPPAVVRVGIWWWSSLGNTTHLRYKHTFGTHFFWFYNVYVLSIIT